VPGIVTLLTDFGLDDTYVAEMKAVLLGGTPRVTTVDITHSITPGDVRAAAFLLNRAWHRFPEGSVHLVVVDPGVGTHRRPIALSCAGHFFVGPDNGVFTPVLDAADIVEIPVPHHASATFHGRDVFAPAAARLAHGEPLSSLGASVTDPVRSELPRAKRSAGRTTGVVVLIDRFGNLITNVPGTWVTPETEIMVGGIAVGKLRRTFGDVQPGEFVAYVGSGGTVEIGIRDSSAAQRSGVRAGSEVVGITV
jgi:S-adenosyl-L-methionine hydrolase (adenosine-forming)